MGDDRPSNLIAGAKELMAVGYDACKFNICEELQIVDTNRKVDGIVRQLCELREAMGSAIDLAFDFHGRVHAPMAKVLFREIEHLRPIFVEDAVVSTQIDAIADLARYTSIPQGAGLGIDVNEPAVIAAAARGHTWRAPTWRHKDGSIAEW